MVLQYTFTNDILFKMLFVQHPLLLKKLVAELLGIRLESIEEFVITNPDIPPEVIDDKFCRLDVNMSVDGQLVDLEIQVRNEGDYPERVLYYWAREYGTALASGGDYKNLPRTVIISILNFNLFACADFHSEFQALEVTRHEPLSDKMSLHFFELRKLPKTIKRDDRLKVWLSLFRAKTEEELQQIEKLEFFAHIKSKGVRKRSAGDGRSHSCLPQGNGRGQVQGTGADAAQRTDAAIFTGHL